MQNLDCTVILNPIEPQEKLFLEAGLTSRFALH
jgi:hypothetical protein